jgi:hypothetical protein
VGGALWLFVVRRIVLVCSCDCFVAHDGLDVRAGYPNDDEAEPAGGEGGLVGPAAGHGVEVLLGSGGDVGEQDQRGAGAGRLGERLLDDLDGVVVVGVERLREKSGDLLGR